MTIDLKKLREAAKQAPSGKRTYEHSVNDGGYAYFSVMRQDGIYEFWAIHGYDLDSENDAKFIALANPATILALIERVEKAEAALKLVLPVLADEHECRICSFDPSDDDEYIRPVREAEAAVLDALGAAR